MRTVILMIAFSKFNKGVFAQTLEEWTQQKQTQIKYLLNQVAANKVYIAYLQKGYSIASKGLTTIGQIKNGEYTLHKDFFNSLLSINPAIKNWSKVASIIAIQVQLTKHTNNVFNRVKELDQLTPDELLYCNTIIQNLFKDCEEIIRELLIIIADGNLEMKDDERIRRIDQLHVSMQSNFTFCTKLNNQMHMLSVQRIHERAAIHLDKTLNAVE